MSDSSNKTLRKKYEDFFAPWGSKVSKLGVTANSISIIAVIISILSCLSYSLGSYWGLILGTLFLGFSSLFDMLDGSVARATNTSSHFGALLDRTFDRVAEFFFLLGIMIGGYSDPSLIFYCFEGMILSSYVRSTAESQGKIKMDSSKGVFERKEKLLLLSFGCLVQAAFIIANVTIDFPIGLIEIILIIIGTASNVSAFQRLFYAKTLYEQKEN